MSHLVEIFVRARCGLCREAERVVAEVVGDRARVRLVDVDTERRLTDRFGVRVPVVALDGVEVAEGVVDRADLEAALGSI